LKLLTALHVFRVPIATLASLALLPWIALGPAAALMSNLVRELGPGEVFAVAVVATLTAFSAVTATNLILYYGDERFDQASAWFQPYQGWPVYWCGFLAMIPLLWTVSAHSTVGAAVAAGLSAAGVFTAFLGATAARMLQLLIADPKSPMPSVALMPDIPLLTPLFNWLYGRQLGVARLGWAQDIQNWVQRATSRVPDWLGAGYFRYQSGVATELYGGHAFAASLTAVSFGVYIWGGRRIPTLAYVLILLLLASWLFSALAFFGDRYRVPVLTLFALFCGASLVVTDTDHYFPVYPGGGGAPSPRAVLLRGAPESVVVAAAEGGGIHAAGWSSRVLTGLAIEEPRFGSALRAVSGVSGGAVGAFYYANAHFGRNKPDAATLERAWRDSMESSLDEVAWGLTNPDLQRAVAPLGWLLRWKRFEDRGQALERTFEDRSRQHASADEPAVRLSEWARQTGEGRMPAVLLNATIVERGSPLVFSSTAFPAARNQSIYNLEHLMGSAHDIAVSTAVRLSATFPVVSPAARLYLDDGKAPPLHVVDGGYYDNLGVSTLVAWLREALPDPGAGPVKRVLVLKLHSFPASVEDPGAERSWLYQLKAPLDTILDVRTAAQIHRGGQELQLLREAWSGRVDVVVREVRFPGCEAADPPLSWRLRSDQQKCIADGWTAVRGGALEAVRRFLDGPG
jgi:hypothetical protein